jgi:ribosomal protein S18
MTKMPSCTQDRYAHLRANAAAQKQATIDRLTQAIVQLEAEGRPVNTFTIKEVCGLDYMAYYRNAEALALFRTHSTHLRREREKEQAKRRRSKGKNREQDEGFYQAKAASRDPLLAYKKPDLAAKLRAALAERDQIQHRMQTELEEKEQHYLALLQEHMQCGLTIAKLEAQLAEYLAFMQRFRSALSSEEHGTQ